MQSEIIRGGYGNNTYNNWFQVRITEPAWIILIKAGSKLATENAIPSQQIRSQTNTRFEFGVYDLNQVPIEGRMILDNPFEFRGQVAGAESDLYNFPTNELGYKLNSGGDDMFFPLEPGNYLICISACMNEYFTYAAGLVIEFQTPSDENFILTEAREQSFVLQETALTTDVGFIFDTITSPITVNRTVSQRSAFTDMQAIIESGVYVQVNEMTVSGAPLTWYIGPQFPNVDDVSTDKIILDATPNWNDTQRNRSLSEWKTAWERENPDRFPVNVFAPYANTQ